MAIRKGMSLPFSLSMTEKWLKGIIKLYFSSMGILTLLKDSCYFFRINRVLYKATIRPGVSTLWQGFCWVAESYGLHLPLSLSPPIHPLTFSTFAGSNIALLSFPVFIFVFFFPHPVLFPTYHDKYIILLLKRTLWVSYSNYVLYRREVLWESRWHTQGYTRNKGRSRSQT